MAKKSVAQARGRRRSVFPAHLRSTPTEWRALKRQEWLEVMQALGRYNHGSAYAPAGDALYKLEHLARQIREALDAPGWVVW